MAIPVYSPPLDLITTSLIDFFEQSGRTVYDGAYAGNPVTPSYPYSIVYSLPGGSSEPFPDLDLDLTAVTATWQITAVSNLRNQAEATARMFRDLLCARTAGDWRYPITVPSGWQVVTRTPDPMLGGVVRTGDTPNAVFSSPFKFALTITPS